LSVASQLGDPGSMLELYRSALRIRRSEPALGMGELRWRESPSEVLFFERGEDFGCVTNISDQPVELPPHRELLLASGPLLDGALPVDATAWIRPARKA
jgi:alpha-glucosidase